MKEIKSKSLRELIELAKQWGISGYSKLKKSELVGMLSRKLKNESAGKSASSSPEKPDGKPSKTQSARAIASKVRAKPPAQETAQPVPERAQPKAAPPVVQELPRSYGDGRMVLVARDPYWLYAYWDLTAEQEKLLHQGAEPVLRVLELAKDAEAREVRRLTLTRDARSWYVQVDVPNRNYRAELGVLDKKDRFECIISSNPSFTPRASVSARGKGAFGKFNPGKPPTKAEAPAGAQGQALAERMHLLSVRGEKSGLSSAQALEELEKMGGEGLGAGVSSGGISSYEGRRRKP